MTPEEYEELRSNATHFAVAPAEMHVVPEVERVVEERERYWVVEKQGEERSGNREFEPDGFRAAPGQSTGAPTSCCSSTSAPESTR